MLPPGAGEGEEFLDGAVFQLHNGPVFTLDFFQVNIDDRLGVTSNIAITNQNRAALTVSVWTSEP